MNSFGDDPIWDLQNPDSLRTRPDVMERTPLVLLRKMCPPAFLCVSGFRKFARTKSINHLCAYE
jgi:hypothetical protein